MVGVTDFHLEIFTFILSTMQLQSCLGFRLCRHLNESKSFANLFQGIPTQLDMAYRPKLQYSHHKPFHCRTSDRLAHLIEQTFDIDFC